MLICQKDVWWDYANDNIAKISFENVAKAIEDFIIPWFEAHSSDEAIKKMLLDEQEKRGGRLSEEEQAWLEMLDNHNDYDKTIEDNIKLFSLPKSLIKA